MALPFRKLPAKSAPIVFGLLLSGLMSLIVSGVSTQLAVGAFVPALSAWPGAWLSSWAVAFPAVLVVAPIVRRLVARLVDVAG